MAYLDHDLGPEGTRAPDRPVQRRQASSPVLDLQRLAGNAAVSQAMQSGRLGSTVIQREGEDEEIDDEGEQEAGDESAGEEEAAAVEEEEKDEG